MDIFSGVKNLHSQNYEKLSTASHSNNIKIQNTGNIPKKAAEKSNNIEKDLNKSSKEEIKKELQRITQELNKAMNPLNTAIKFHFNDKIDELTVKVIDKKNNEIIREFPPKEALRLMEKMRELVGMLFDKKG